MVDMSIGLGMGEGAKGSLSPGYEAEINAMAAAKWGKARIEVAALSAEIRDRLTKLEPVTQIYEDLRQAGKVTVSERSFHRWTKPIQAAVASITMKAAPVAAGALSVPAKPSGRPVPAPSPISERVRAVSGSGVDAGTSRVITAGGKRLITATAPIGDLWGNSEANEENTDGND